jgi:hypothetical protein
MDDKHKILIQEVIDNLLYIKDIDKKIEYTNKLLELNKLYSIERNKNIKVTTQLKLNINDK